MSWCDCPPGRKIMIHALWEIPSPETASACSSCGSVHPPMTSPPIYWHFQRESMHATPRKLKRGPGHDEHAITHNPATHRYERKPSRTALPLFGGRSL